MAERIGIAVIDSGANVPHPHLPAVAGGVSIDLKGTVGDDWVDRLGHGTAVASAIHEKAPEADLWAVKVFDDALATSVATLVRAIDWATEKGLRLVNLSLGTPNDFRAAELEPAVRRAIESGILIVSARELDGRPMYPGCMPGVVGVVLDWDQPRETVRVVEASRPDPMPADTAETEWVVAASGYPRPIPGVPPRRNLNGISFAVANATGVLASVLAETPAIRTAEDALTALAATRTR